MTQRRITSSPDRSSYGPKLNELRPLAPAFRLTVRRHRGQLLACELWQETLGSRGFYANVEQIDRWYADDPAPFALTRDHVSELLAEAILQRRLPGID